VLLVFGPLLLLDLAYFCSTALKIPDGGYVPLILGSRHLRADADLEAGAELLFSRFRQDSLPLKSFLRAAAEPHDRVPGIAVFMTGQADFVPARCCTTSSTTRSCTSACCS
jgi:KUP system potassium uptake protein